MAENLKKFNSVEFVGFVFSKSEDHLVTRPKQACLDILGKIIQPVGYGKGIFFKCREA